MGDDVVVTGTPFTVYIYGGVPVAPAIEGKGIEKPLVVEPVDVGAGGAAGAVLIEKVAGGEEGTPEGLRGITVMVY